MSSPPTSPGADKADPPALPLSAELIEAMFQYLIKRPYQEVAPILARLQAEVGAVRAHVGDDNGGIPVGPE